MKANKVANATCMETAMQDVIKFAQIVNEVMNALVHFRK